MLKNIDSIRAESTFKVLGIFGNFNTQKVQKNIKKTMQNCKADILKRCTK